MDSYTETLNLTFSQIVKTYNKFQLSNHSKSSLDLGNDIIKQGVKLLKSLKEHVKAFESVLTDCQDLVNEITDDLSQTPKEEDFVYHSSNGMLSYIGRDFVPKQIVEINERPINKLVTNV